MSVHETVSWLVSYDISDSRRGARVCKLLKSRGIPVQYSVFLVHATRAEMHALMRSLEALIATATDDLRAYRVPQRTEVHQLGGTMLPQGTLILEPSPATPKHRHEASMSPSRPERRDCPSEAAKALYSADQQVQAHPLRASTTPTTRCRTTVNCYVEPGSKP